MKSILTTLLLAFSLLTLKSIGQEVIELKQPLSDKIIIKLMFRNGSITDPKAKEGLTSATANTLTEGGTKTLTNKHKGGKAGFLI